MPLHWESWGGVVGGGGVGVCVVWGAGGGVLVVVL